MLDLGLFIAEVGGGIFMVLLGVSHLVERRPRTARAEPHRHNWGRWARNWSGSMFQTRRCRTCGFSEQKELF